jgi:hypothetical protein
MMASNISVGIIDNRYGENRELRGRGGGSPLRQKSKSDERGRSWGKFTDEG